MNLDKQVTLQIIGCLMQKPSLLAEVDNYSLIPDDFDTTFEKYVFMSIANLANNGADKITVVDIDTYLSEKPPAYEIFTKHNGIEYLQDAYEFANVENFPYYYTKLKKYNAIKDLQKMGYDTNRICPEGDFLEARDYEQLEKFENMSVADIFNVVKTDIAAAEQKYNCQEAKTANASANLRQLLLKLKNEPDLGVPFQGNILNTVVRGARKGKFYIMSAMSGGSKTRTMVGEACYMAYPIRFDSQRQQWVNVGNCEHVLYVGTEQVIDEIQTMILAYLTDINEEKILSCSYTQEEQERIDTAIEIMELYKDNFIIAQLPEPNIAQVKTLLRYQCLNNKCDYIFYDYIFATPSLLNEFRDLTIRADVALRLLSTTLKDLAVELNCFIMSATQITGMMEYKKGYIRNYLMLRDSKSIADKADFAAIKAKILTEEMEMISKLCEKIGMVPNQVTDVYKMRRGKYVDVRIWSRMDLGTCRNTDLFITDANFNVVTDFEPVNVVVDYEDNEDTMQKVQELNKMFVVNDSTGEIVEESEWTDTF